MKIISLANQKGGQLKTTSTYNLAVCKIMEGKKVLMIDLDPQASLTICCGLEPGTNDLEGHGIAQVLEGKQKITDCAITVDTVSENLYLVPSDIDLAKTERDMITGRGGYTRLKKALEGVEKYFDYCFIDCAPQLSILLDNALLASDGVIVPAETEYLSYKGLRALMSTIEDIKNNPFESNPDLQMLGVIATKYRSNVNDHKDVLGVYEKNYNLLGVIKLSADGSKAIIDGKPAVMAYPNSSISEEYKKISKSI